MCACAKCRTAAGVQQQPNEPRWHREQTSAKQGKAERSSKPGQCAVKRVASDELAARIAAWCVSQSLPGRATMAAALAFAAMRGRRARATCVPTPPPNPLNAPCSPGPSGSNPSSPIGCWVAARTVHPLLPQPGLGCMASFRKTTFRPLDLVNLQTLGPCDNLQTLGPSNPWTL